MGENIVHLVLARTPGAPPGTKAMSLFIVPKYLVTESAERGQRNDVVLAGLNHKMGNRGTIECRSGVRRRQCTSRSGPAGRSDT